MAQPVEQTLRMLARLSTVLLPGQQVLELRPQFPLAPPSTTPNLGLDRLPVSDVCFASISELPTTCAADVLILQMDSLERTWVCPRTT